MALKARQTLAVQIAQHLSDIIIRSELKPGEIAAETVRAFFRHEKEYVVEKVRDKEGRTEIHSSHQ